MNNKLLGLLFILCGGALVIAAVAAEIAWLGLCFGTVIIGIAMLFLAPALLIAPMVFIGGTGVALWSKGFELID